MVSLIVILGSVELCLSAHFLNKVWLITKVLKQFLVMTTKHDKISVFGDKILPRELFTNGLVLFLRSTKIIEQVPL